MLRVAEYLAHRAQFEGHLIMCAATGQTAPVEEPALRVNDGLHVDGEETCATSQQLQKQVSLLLYLCGSNTLTLD